MTADFNGFGLYKIAGGQWTDSGGGVSASRSLTLAPGATLTVASGTLTDNGSITNAGSVDASGPGILLISDTTLTNGASGQVEAHSLVKLKAGAISGIGTLTVWRRRPR